LKKNYAFILIPRPDISPLIYLVPDNLDLNIGDVVEIELRKTKTWGIIEKFCQELPDNIKVKSIKPIAGKIISSPIFKDKKKTAFLKWLSEYYLYPFPKIIKQLFSPIISNKNTLIGNSDPEMHIEATESRKPDSSSLNSDQKKVVSSIKERWEAKNFSPTLVYGVTGSGKSEIFASLCRDVISSGKQVLYLVPEIGLTTGALDHLIERIGEKGVVLHSFMSKKKRFSSMYNAMNKKVEIIVGTRSAVTYPFFDLGLIIVDEEHDGSYKNFEPPYYHARDAAIMKAAMMDIPIVLGSATPSSDSWHNCSIGKYNLEILTKRANEKPLPEIKSFPFKGDLYLPSSLILKVAESIKNNEQSLFFLNRRGFATFAICPECEATQKCPDCNTALVYHKKSGKLLCHHCNFSKTKFFCSECGHNKLNFEGLGIEKLVETLMEFFPDSKLISFDKDSLKNIRQFDKAVEDISQNKYNIITGTVMVSKGHNFPNLKNVIIKYADYLLSFKETRAAEKCFQTITQVAGRAGRFNVEGKIWAEALYPDHYIWKHLKKHDYPGFIREELSWRERLELPPFTKITILRISGKNEKQVSDTAQSIYDKIGNAVSSSQSIKVFPPEEPPLSRIKNRVRKNIMIISPKTTSANNYLKTLFFSLSTPAAIALTFDIDAISET